MVVVFNNVTYQNLECTEKEIKEMKKERINSYKTALENVAIRFYRVDLSE